MRLYAESSAVVAWLLNEPGADRIREALQSATLVSCSDLTAVESERAILRALALGRIGEAAATSSRAMLLEALDQWYRLPLDGPVLDRACRPFPAEPLRTLDALHLASALVGQAAIPGLVLLSLDERVRRSGEILGFGLAPANLRS